MYLIFCILGLRPCVSKLEMDKEMQGLQGGLNISMFKTGLAGNCRVYIKSANILIMCCWDDLGIFTIISV